MALCGCPYPIGCGLLRGVERIRSQCKDGDVQHFDEGLSIKDRNAELTTFAVTFLSVCAKLEGQRVQCDSPRWWILSFGDVLTKGNLMSKLDRLVQEFLAQKEIAVVGVSDKRETGCNLAYRKFKGRGTGSALSIRG